MKLAIVGSRNYRDFDTVEKHVLQNFKIDDIEAIISGGADGVDSLAEKFAQKYGIPTIIFKSNWAKYGKAAGPHRNTDIIMAADSVIAFPTADSKGTYDSINKARKHNRQLIIINV